MANIFSRRAFTRLLGATAATTATLPFVPGSSSLTPSASAQSTSSSGRSFPQGFLWGSATASYQVEGAVKEEGRGPSIWDTFSHTPGKTHNGDTGDVADDHFHLYKEDIALMKNLGLTVYRFSIAWSRVFPQGTGAPNPKGLDFYNRMLDSLLEAGIAPYCTLYHWDLPQTLEDKGGWQNHDTAKAFADYAGYTAGKLSDRIQHFMTMNEIRSFTELGYGNGQHAPGLKVGPQKFAQVCHHAVLGHGLAVQAIRAAARPGTKIGFADNATATSPVIDTPEHVEAATRAMREENAAYLTVIREGKYTDLYLKRLGANAPKFTAEEMKIIGSPLDFQGLNVYQPMWIRAVTPEDNAHDHEQGYADVPGPSSYPHMFSPWLTFGPEGIYWSPRLANKLWDLKEIYITENGSSSADVPTAQGTVLDTDRTMFLRNYLTQLQRAVTDGVPVKGYFLWSLLDNYEWADGYEKRFGITYVDFKTQKRTPKLSSQFYKEVIRTNTVS